MPTKYRLVLMITAVAAILACSPTSNDPKDPIVFNDLGWDSALSQNRIAQYIVEKGYGYPTDMSIWRIDNDASHADTAIWWLNNNPGIWRQWVTDEAATAIQEALDGVERAEGWPDVYR